MHDEELRRRFRSFGDPVAAGAEPPDPTAIRRRGGPRPGGGAGRGGHHPGHHRPATGRPQPTLGGPPSPTGTTAPQPTSPSTTSAPPTSAAEVGPPGGPVPKGLRPQSVTFVSAGLGWALGDAPGRLPPCTSLVHTRDGGRTWDGVRPPVAPIVPAGQTTGDPDAVSEVRFADPRNGWLYSPGLYSTHDGGARWRPVTTVVGRILDLEADGGWVYAAVSGCRRDQLCAPQDWRMWATPVGDDAWRPVRIPATAPQPARAELILADRSWWLLAWTPEDGTKLHTGGPGGSGRGSSATSPARSRVVPGRRRPGRPRRACVDDAGAGSQGKRVHASGDAAAVGGGRRATRPCPARSPRWPRPPQPRCFSPSPGPVAAWSPPGTAAAAGTGWPMAPPSTASAMSASPTSGRGWPCRRPGRPVVVHPGRRPQLVALPARVLNPTQAAGAARHEAGPLLVGEQANEAGANRSDTCRSSLSTNPSASSHRSRPARRSTGRLGPTPRAGAGARLFPSPLFADLFQPTGRRSVPPSILRW